MEQKKPQKSVAIVAMGASAAQYVQLASNLGTRLRVADETWAINCMGGVIDHDLLFHMDDCKVQEARAERKPEGAIAGMVTWLKDHPKFVTSRAYPDYPGAIEFPLQDVINKFNSTYFNNTVAYAVAYALYQGFTRIMMFGCDYHYDNAPKAESGRGCVEYWLAIAACHGVEINVASASSLMDANVPDCCRFYGYDAVDVKLQQAEKGVQVEFTEREKLPTAEEIEKRYKHE